MIWYWFVYLFRKEKITFHENTVQYRYAVRHESQRSNVLAIKTDLCKLNWKVIFERKSKQNKNDLVQLKNYIVWRRLCADQMKCSYGIKRFAAQKWFESDKIYFRCVNKIHFNMPLWRNALFFLYRCRI